MKPYTSPEVIEVGVAADVILGAKQGSLWDEIEQAFTMHELSVVDVDE